MAETNPTYLSRELIWSFKRGRLAIASSRLWLAAGRRRLSLHVRRSKTSLARISSTRLLLREGGGAACGAVFSAVLGAARTQV